MPYFVYKISPGPVYLIKKLQALDQFEKYKEARLFARQKMRWRRRKSCSKKA